jgi:hypothetical protein
MFFDFLPLMFTRFINHPITRNNFDLIMGVMHKYVGLLKMIPLTKLLKSYAYRYEEISSHLLCVL